MTKNCMEWNIEYQMDTPQINKEASTLPKGLGKTVSLIYHASWSSKKRNFKKNFLGVIKLEAVPADDVYVYKHPYMVQNPIKLGTS
jgi:hypothetical protein